MEKPIVLNCLARALIRDAEKGGDGSRSTREVADWCDMSVSQARNALWAAEERGEVDVFKGFGRQPILWRLNKAPS